MVTFSQAPISRPIPLTWLQTPVTPFSTIRERKVLGVFDLEDNRQIETPKNIGVDVRDGELAFGYRQWRVIPLPRARARAFCGRSFALGAHICLLRAASVAPALDKLAVDAVDGEGALFQKIANGKRIMSFLSNFQQ